ncbi:MAG: MFS transporter [Rhodobacteraceae bacterium]|nr:MFS transporter [Paracoccaceae bacterium]
MRRPFPAHFSVYFSFFIYALTLAAMFPRLGDLQRQMGIAEGMLGLALIGAPLGAQIMLMFGGPLVERLGYRKVMMIGVVLLGVAEVAASTATSAVVFFGFWAVGGLGIGMVEIVVNLEADRVEHRLGRRIMNRSHAFWSIGFFIAGMIGAGVAQLGVSPTIHLAVMAVATTTLTVVFLRNYQPAPARPAAEGAAPKFVRPTRGILLIVAFTLSAMLLEGAGFDWSVIFMRDTYHTVPFISGMALALTALTQGITRFFADNYVDRFGPVPVAKASILTLGIGVLFVTFSINPVTALIGFALLGVGNGVVFPLAMSAAAQRTDRPAATNVAALAQLSFITFLIAPALLGFVAEHLGIRVSFGIGIPFVLLSWYAVRSLSPTKPKALPA